MDPYCPYGSPLSWIPIVLDPYCPGSLMSWFHFVLDPSCPGSILSWIHLVLDPSCPGSFLSWFHFVLDPFCPGSILSPLVRSERSALTRKYRAWTLAMEWHWQRTTFPANGPTTWKKNRTEIWKNIILRGNWFEVRANEKIQEWNWIIFDFELIWKDRYT